MSWSLVNKGVGLLRQGDLPAALDCLERAAAARPHEPRIWLQLGQARLENDEYEPAVAAFNKALELAPEHPPTLLYLALTRLELDHQDAVDDLVARLRRVCPGNQILPTFMALVALRRGKPLEAVRALELPPTRPSSVMTRPELLPAAPFAGRLLAAVERWLLPLETPVLEPGVALQAGPAQAVVAAEPLSEQFKSLGTKLTSQFESWYQQTVGMRALERSFAARDYPARIRGLASCMRSLERASELHPDLFRGRYNLGEAKLLSAIAANSAQRAEVDPAELARLEAEVPFVAQPAGRANPLLKEAYECFLESWTSDGPNPYLFYYLAKTSLLLGQVEAARGYFEEALTRFAKLSEAHYGLGQCAVLLEQPTVARRMLCLASMSDLQAARERLLEFSYRVEAGQLNSLPPLPKMQAPPGANHPTRPRAQRARYIRRINGNRQAARAPRAGGFKRARHGRAARGSREACRFSRARNSPRAGKGSG
jgi:tetratricopeptide (TPR) repeat protein